MTRTQIARTELVTNFHRDAVDLELRADGELLISVQHDGAEVPKPPPHGQFTLARDAEALTIKGTVRLDGRAHRIDQTHAIADLGEATWHIHDPGMPLIDRIRSLDDFMSEFRDEDADAENLFTAEFVGDKWRADLERTEEAIGHRYPRALHEFLQFEFAAWGETLWYPSLKWAQPYTVTDWLRRFGTPEDVIASHGIYGPLYSAAFGTVHWDPSGGNLRVLAWLPCGVARMQAYQLGLFPDKLGPQDEGLWFEARDDDQWRPVFTLDLDGRAMNAEEALLQRIRREVLAQSDELIHYGVMGDLADGHVLMDSASPAGRLVLWLRDQDDRAAVRLTQQ